MPGDDAKRPFRTYRGRGDDAGTRSRSARAPAPPASRPRLPAAPPEPAGRPPPRPRRVRRASRPRRRRAGAPASSCCRTRTQPAAARPGPPAARRRRPRAPAAPRGAGRWRRIALAVLGALLVLCSGSASATGSSAARSTRQPALRRAHARRARARRLAALGRLDHARARLRPPPRRRPGRSDSILLVRIDPGRNRIAELSIPRDLRVTIPGHGDDRINAAYTLGGPALAIRTVRALTGIPINHVVLVDFSGFRELVDALGGVTIDNPTKIISNSFDGHPWRFGRGRLHLDGRHALAYARVRENTPTRPTTTSRAACASSACCRRSRSASPRPSTLLHLPRVGSAIGKPLATDLSANDLLELGWRQLRASSTLHCHLGGTITSVGGASELIGGDENRRVILAVLGKSAPSPPRRATRSPPAAPDLYEPSGLIGAWSCRLLRRRAVAARALRVRALGVRALRLGALRVRLRRRRRTMPRALLRAGVRRRARFGACRRWRPCAP